MVNDCDRIEKSYIVIKDREIPQLYEKRARVGTQNCTPRPP
jgi:hypothetical protein